MPFTIIRGSFHLVGTNKAGGAYGFEPDGDSIQFKPDKPSLLNKLEQSGHAYKLSGIGSLNLRFEGIDATELHHGGQHQPMEPGTGSRDYLRKLLGPDPVRQSASGVRFSPPAPPFVPWKPGSHEGTAFSDGAALITKAGRQDRPRSGVRPRPMQCKYYASLVVVS